MWPSPPAGPERGGRTPEKPSGMEGIPQGARGHVPREACANFLPSILLPPHPPPPEAPPRCGDSSEIGSMRWPFIPAVCHLWAQFPSAPFV